MLRSAAGEANERPLQNPFGADEVCRMAWVVFWGGGGVVEGLTCRICVVGPRKSQ